MLYANRMGRLAVLLGCALLAACGTVAPGTEEPRARVQAQEIEAQAERSLAQGDHAAAVRQFAEAARLRLSMDEREAAGRNRLRQAEAELARRQPEAALELAGTVNDASLAEPALLLRVQANLALGRVDVARPLLNRLGRLCASGCERRGHYLLLRARMAWIDGNIQAAQRDAEAAVPALRAPQDERDLANAWRLIAAARLQTGSAASALTAAQTALELDKQLAASENIVRDWLLIGDILRRAGKAEAKTAYLRARSVAEAAGLPELAAIAEQALAQEAR